MQIGLNPLDSRLFSLRSASIFRQSLGTKTSLRREYNQPQFNRTAIFFLTCVCVRFPRLPPLLISPLQISVLLRLPKSTTAERVLFYRLANIIIAITQTSPRSVGGVRRKKKKKKKIFDRLWRPTPVTHVGETWHGGDESEGTQRSRDIFASTFQFVISQMSEARTVTARPRHRRIPTDAINNPWNALRACALHDCLSSLILV